MYFIILASIIITGLAKQFITSDSLMTTLNEKQCLKQSPRYDIKYEQETIHKQANVYYCDRYAKRTCCSEKNFNELKYKWFKEYSNIFDISPQCYEMYQSLICSECDGDIGTGIRKGLCPQYCYQMYKACYHDLFQVDEKTQKLRFCQKNDVLCSELRFITTKPEEYCLEIGYQINTYDKIDEMAENLDMNVTWAPTCWDGTPSSNIWIETTKPIPVRDIQTSFWRTQNFLIVGLGVFFCFAFAILLCLWLGQKEKAD